MGDQRTADPEDWVDRHGDGLYRYALLRLRVPDLAADAVQETFLEALRARGSFAGRSSERTWLVGILRHKILDHFRRAAREEAAHEETSSEAGDEPAFDARGHWRVGPTSWGTDPARDLEAAEFREVLRRCLERLPEGIAHAFLLRELDGLGAAEVQGLLGISPANLWTRLHRARSLLRGCLEAHWFGRRQAPPAKGPHRP